MSGCLVQLTAMWVMYNVRTPLIYRTESVFGRKCISFDHYHTLWSLCFGMLLLLFSLFLSSEVCACVCVFMVFWLFNFDLVLFYAKMCPFENFNVSNIQPIQYVNQISNINADVTMCSYVLYIGRPSEIPTVCAREC